VRPSKSGARRLARRKMTRARSNLHVWYSDSAFTYSACTTKKSMLSVILEDLISTVYLAAPRTPVFLCVLTCKTGSCAHPPSIAASGCSSIYLTTKMREKSWFGKIICGSITASLSSTMQLQVALRNLII
jgi:hypothetical protein